MNMPTKHSILPSLFLLSALLLCSGAVGLEAQTSSGSASKQSSSKQSHSKETKNPIGSEVFGNVVRMDKVVHDFGDILVDGGPVTAVFKATNIGKEAIVVHNVVSSCGCTEAEWTRQPVRPGESASITATFKNEDGPYPFDKSLTVYVSGLKQPIILRLRGDVHKKEKSLDRKYPIHFGDLGFKSEEIAQLNLNQGRSKGGEVLVANIGSKPIDVKFADVSEGLVLEVSPNPIPAGQTARLVYILETDRSRWGKNRYYATPLVGGKSAKAVQAPRDFVTLSSSTYQLIDNDENVGIGKERVCITATTREDFLSWTQDQIDNGPSPIADQSTYAFGKVKAGQKLSGSFTITNQGRSPFKLHKVDSETKRVETSAFAELAPGAKGILQFTFDTEGLKEGEHIVLLSLTTNSPLRPIMNLFVTCQVE